MKTSTWDLACALQPLQDYVSSGAYEPPKAAKERPTTHHTTERHLNLNHLTHLPKKECNTYLAKSLVGVTTHAQRSRLRSIARMHTCVSVT